MLILAGVALGSILTFLTNWVLQREARADARAERRSAALSDLRRERLRPLFDLVAEMEAALAYRMQKYTLERGWENIPGETKTKIPADRMEEVKSYVEAIVLKGVIRSESVVTFPVRALALITRLNDRRIGDPLTDVAFTLQTDADFDIGECAMKLVAVHERLESYVAGA